MRIIVPLLGGGFGAKCDFHFEGHVAALARAARRPVKLVFSRREEFVAVDHRREGMVIELETGAKRDGTLVARPRPARARQGRLLRRGRLLRADGGDARLWPVQDRERQRRVVAELLEHPAVELDPRPDGAAGLLGARAAHGRARARARARSRRAAAADPDRGGRRGPDAADVREARDEGDARACRRADRLRPGAARRRGDRRRLRLVAVLRRRLGRLREAQRRRHRQPSSPARRRTGPAR